MFDDVHAAFAHAVAEGCTVLAEPAPQPQNQVVGWVRDPFGTLIEIASPSGVRTPPLTGASHRGYQRSSSGSIGRSLVERALQPQLQGVVAPASLARREGVEGAALVGVDEVHRPVLAGEAEDRAQQPLGEAALLQRQADHVDGGGQVVDVGVLDQHPREAVVVHLLAHGRAGLGRGAVQQLLDLAHEPLELARLDLLEADAGPAGREDARPRLERHGGGADGEQGVEVGALGRALAPQDVEQPHEEPVSCR